MEKSEGKVTILDFARWKKKGERIVMITAYDVLFARIFDDVGVDAILAPFFFPRAKSCMVTFPSLFSTVSPDPRKEKSPPEPFPEGCRKRLGFGGTHGT